MDLRGPENDITNNNGSSTLLPYTQSLDRNPNVRYRECLRNHAASAGGNVFDGCGEFMPGGEDGTLESLKCAACDCHRNFHRKEIDGESASNSRRNAVAVHIPPPLPSPTVLHHQRYSTGLYTSPSAVVQPMAVAFGGGNESSSEDLNLFGDGMPQPPPYVLSKKRFRTKFSQEQKDRMMELAEKIGWRINKQDEEVDKFCSESGVRRHVFKVWMHNNKNIKKNQHNQEQEHEPL